MSLATERLREILNERGVEWVHVRLDPNSTAWFAGPYTASADEYQHGLLLVEMVMTPEEAIEATLGRGECHVDDVGYIIANEKATLMQCNRCNGSMWRFDGYQRPNYCPTCGRKVESK